MTEFEIEHDVPIPAVTGTGSIAKYPLSSMEVGDSFFVPFADGETLGRLRDRLSHAAGYWRKQHGGRFTVRTVDGGVRLWRFE